MPRGSARSCYPKFNNLRRPSWGYLRLTAQLLCLSSPIKHLGCNGCFFGGEFKQELHLSCAAVFLNGPWRVSASITARCCRAPVAPCSLKHLTCYISPWIVSDGGGLGQKKKCSSASKVSERRRMVETTTGTGKERVTVSGRQELPWRTADMAEESASITLRQTFLYS